MLHVPPLVDQARKPEGVPQVQCTEVVDACCQLFERRTLDVAFLSRMSLDQRASHHADLSPGCL